MRAEVISLGICRGRERNKKKTATQKTNEYSFPQMLNRRRRECDIIKIQCGYREEKQTKTELRYSKLMYMVRQGGTNLPAH